ncbi:hypothetical protein BDR05DRAFT_948279 [Suillus weaverae]|nr:hypothetical protein BDR05DRAFT_948279 [Suillus weaverae]
MPRVSSSVYSVDTPIRLYGDVVLVHIPSMPGALEATLTGTSNPKSPAFVEQDFGETTRGSEVVSPNENRKPKVTFDLHDESNLLSEGPTKPGNNQTSKWTTVQRKCGRKSPSHEVSEERSWTSDLTQEQADLVELGKKELTENDRKKIEASKCNLNLTRESTESQGEDPSRDKGKVPDPRNWGDLDLEDEEVNLDTQWAALVSFRLA